MSALISAANPEKIGWYYQAKSDLGDNKYPPAQKPSWLAIELYQYMFLESGRANNFEIEIITVPKLSLEIDQFLVHLVYFKPSNLGSSSTLLFYCNF